MKTLSDIRNNLLSKIKKENPVYRNGYVDGVLDVVNEIKNNKLIPQKRLEPVAK